MSQRFKALLIPALLGVMGLLAPVLIIDHATHDASNLVVLVCVLVTSFVGYAQGIYTVTSADEEECTCSGEQEAE